MGASEDELGGWFAEYNAHKICVDAQPRNADARAFYASHGAEPLNDHWLVWPDIMRRLNH